MTQNGLTMILGLPCSWNDSMEKLLKPQGLRYEEDMAAILKREGYLSGAEATEEFERRLMEREFQRDMTYGNEHVWVRAWHIGNLAYMMARNPKLAGEYRERFENHKQAYPRKISAVVMMLPIPVSVERVKARQGNNCIVPPELESLIYDQATNISKLLYTYGIPNVGINAEKPLEEVEAEFSEIIRSGLE